MQERDALASRRKASLSCMKEGPVSSPVLLSPCAQQRQPFLLCFLRQSVKAGYLTGSPRRYNGGILQQLFHPPTLDICSQARDCRYNHTCYHDQFTFFPAVCLPAYYLCIFHAKDKSPIFSSKPAFCRRMIGAGEYIK